MTSHLSPADRAELNDLWDLARRIMVKVEGLLGEDDPMLYDRSDDEVPAMPLPPTVEGFAPTGRPRGHNSSPTGFGAKLPVGVMQGGAAVGAVASSTLRGVR